MTGANTGQATAIFIVDPRTEEAALLSLTPPVNAQVIILDPTRDGFLQVTEQLQNRHDVTELHIIPWTKDNQQWLGSQSVSATLDPAVSNNLIAWDNALVDNAKLVFHGQTSMDASWLDHVGAITNSQTSWLLDSKTDSLSSEQAKTVIFIDSAVQDVADIISSIDASTEIVYLDATKDGLTQIADYLDGRTGIDSVQIISHANQGTLQLGNEILTNANLADHAAQLATIGHSLTLNGDILFYGCDLAKGTDGKQFVDSFSYLTKADVAASTDITGAASKGGNWTLEYTTGTIEASILAASHYQDILALPTFNAVGQPLIFGGDPLLHPVTVMKGNGLQAGDITLFNNVITINGQAIDAVVTIVDLANGNATITSLDNLPLPVEKPRNANWFELNTVSANDPITGLPTNAAATIKFEFILHNTYNSALGNGTDVLLQNVTINSYDIDNLEFQDFSGFSSYSLAGGVVTPTDLTVTTNNGFTRFADLTGGNNIGIDPIVNTATLNQARVTATYNEINTFQIKVGAGNTDVAYFYLEFGPSTYNVIDPAITVRTPTALNDTGTGSTGIPVTVDVTTNDHSDPIGHLDKTTVKIVGADPTGKLTTNEGTWTVVAGAIIFTPAGGFTGNPTPIQYTVKDTGGLESNVATVTITYPPIVRPDTATGITGNPVTLSVLGNDGDTGVILNPATVKIVGTTTAGAPLDVPNEGTWTVNTTTGEITFTPLSTFTGNPTPISYTVKDTGGLESNSTTVTITYPPIVRPDTATGTGTGTTIGTSGSLIQLSNPSPSISSFFDPPIKFFNDPKFPIFKPVEFAKPVDLRLYVPSANDIISLTGSLRDQVVLELKRFSFDIPSWSFRHTNPNAQLEFEATRPDGSALPEWLQFNPKLLRFSGVPPKGAFNEEVMVTARDAHGNEVHAIFYVHVNKESVRPAHKSLAVDLKLMGLSSKVLEKNTHKEKVIGKPALSERMNKIGKMGKLQESRALLDSLNAR